MKTTVKLMAMATAMVALASCMDSDSVYDPDATTKQKEAQFEKQFVQQFGKIDPKNDWGFGMASTRTAYTNANQWKEDSFDYKPADPVTAEELEEVKKAFSQKYDDKSVSQTVNWTDFWVQQVYIGRNTYYKTYPGQNGDSEIKTGIDYTDKMGPMYTYKADGTQDYTENLKAQNCQDVTANDAIFNANRTILFLESGTSSFAYYNSLDSKLHTDNYIILKVGNYYYVGFDFESNFNRDKVKKDENDKIIGWYDGDKNVDGDHIYNDWIVRISPAVLKSSTSEPEPEPEPKTEEITYERRIMCEDLGTTGDFDYNDVVFDVHLENGTAYIRLVAAGGTLPLYIGDMEHEVHELFGVGTSTMVGTGAGPDKDPVTFELKDRTYQNYDDVTVTVKNGESTYELEAPVGGAPKKLCVKGQQKFPTERQNINEVYPKFSNYVSDASTTWYIEP